MILYHIKENMMLIQKERAFLKICEELNIPVKKLRNEDADQQLAAILGKQTMGTTSMQKAPKGYELPEILIFSDMEDSLLDQFLALYKKRNLPPIALKAVVTPFNLSWRLYALIRELQKEDEQMRKVR